ncbi:MAG: H-NS family nucleoid-associated regulatory protein [Succinivibrionaceae bacterium]|nr:H-NS family nucleoid-associated regulatory protein [Succinivibrionaceae bacterium]
MSDFLTTITNIRNLRIACKELSLKELESAHEKLGEILQERKDEEERQNEIARKKNEALINIKAIMANANINPNDLKSLLDSEAQVSTQKRNVPPKYRFTTKDGQIQTWTGQGRTPTEFLNCIKREGNPMEYYLIKEN